MKPLSSRHDYGFGYSLSFDTGLGISYGISTGTRLRLGPGIPLDLEYYLPKGQS